MCISTVVIETARPPYHIHGLRGSHSLGLQLARSARKLYGAGMDAIGCQHDILPLPLAGLEDVPGAASAGGCSGYCRRCGREHGLGAGAARGQALVLMEWLAVKKRIDFAREEGEADPRCSTAPLFGEPRGQMFGVLVGLDRAGNRQALRAFSGQYNGQWQVEGWAPPLFDLALYGRLHDPAEREIKTLGRQLEGLDPASPLRNELVRQRRELSRRLMRDIHALYEIPSFTGRTAGLDELFQGNGIPTGAGDCCAPKLLNQAARHGIIPLGLAEFYWGRENRSASRQHGRFYPSCTSKCRPILGFMLCGLGEKG